MELPVDCWVTILRVLLEFVPSKTSAVEDENVSAELVSVRLSSKAVLRAFNQCDGFSLWADALRVEREAKVEQTSNLEFALGHAHWHGVGPLVCDNHSDAEVFIRELKSRVRVLHRRLRRIAALLRLHSAKKESDARLAEPLGELRALTL
jgi:hypothetical protein